jgi:hypothetical protein
MAGVIIHILERIGSAFLQVFQQALSSMVGLVIQRSRLLPFCLGGIVGVMEGERRKKPQAVVHIQICLSHALLMDLN